MNINNFAKIICCVIIGILLTVGIMIPLIESAENNNYEVYFNDTTHAKPYSELKSGDVVRSDNMTDLYVNDELITRSNVIGENYVKTSNFLLGGGSLIRISPAGDSISYVQGLTSITMTMTDDTTATIDGVNSNGSFNVTFENIDWGFVATNTGDWAEPYYYSPGLIYINDVNQVYGCGPVDGSSHFYNFNGSTLRLETTEQDTPIAFNLTDEGHGVYSFSPALSGDVVATTDGGDTFDVRNFIVPIEIVSGPITPQYVFTIIGLIPIFVIIGLIVGVVVHIRFNEI